MRLGIARVVTRIVAVSAAVFAAQAFAGDYRAPRLPDGSPDLQGVWTNATATPMERSPELGDRRAFTAEEAAAISKAALAAVAADAAPSDPGKKIEAIESLPPVGNYNLFWTDRGMSVANINGEYRTSMIIEPSNGRIPALTADGQQRTGGARRTQSERRSRRTRARRALPAVVRLGLGSADAAGDVQQLLPDRAVAGLRGDPRRDGARRAHHPDPEQHTPATTSASGWATRSVTGKATRWWSRRATSVPSRVSAALRECSRDRALHARRPTTRSSIGSCRRSGDVHEPFTGELPFVRSTPTSTSTRATRAITRCRASSRVRAKPRSATGEGRGMSCCSSSSRSRCACPRLRASSSRREFDSPALQRKWTYAVYLPDGYETSHLALSRAVSAARSRRRSCTTG